MIEFREEDRNLPTLLCKQDNPTLRIECKTLDEAVIEVAKWPGTDQERARFGTTGKCNAQRADAQGFWHAPSRRGCMFRVTELRPRV
jgi:hypothetical protein